MNGSRGLLEKAIPMRLIMRACVAVVLALGLTAAAAPNAGAADKQVFQSPDLPPGLPFSAAVRAGDLIYISGAIGHARGEPRLVGGGIGPETEQALTYVKETLERAGSSLEHVVKCTVFLADIADFAAMNEVYRTFFPEAPPARSTVAVAALALGARAEIECIALAGD
jgi:2-iminobutanoate/2-iminopropanoate deaminase